MVKSTKRERMYERIRQHGENLLAIFPRAIERDPVKLCKKLRRLESLGNAHALRLCNGPEYASEHDAWAVKERILTKVQILLGYATGEVKVFINQDPRGYALKIDDAWIRANMKRMDIGRALGALHHDWGGYGILAPDFANDDN